MSALIKLPDGTPALFHASKWYCPDPKAIPALEYCAAQATGDIYTNPGAQIAEQVAQMIVGSRLVYYDPTEPQMTDEEVKAYMRSPEFKELNPGAEVPAWALKD